MASAIDGILFRFNSLYPLLAKQRAKQTGAVHAQAYISASNLGKQADSTSANALDVGLTMVDKVKLIATLAKSEITTLQTSQEASQLANEILPRVDEICQGTDVAALISGPGIFMICILVRLVRLSDSSTCREILKILIVRAANYLIWRTAQYEQEDVDANCELEVSLDTDDILSDQMHLASYVLRKGVLAHELAQGKPVTETCNLLREALASLEAHNSQVRTPEELKPSRFAPTALWYKIVRIIYERIHEVKGLGHELLAEQAELIECSANLLNTTFNVLRSFKDASKYNVRVGSEGKALLLHGGIVRVSQLFGAELDHMIQFAVLHLTAVPEDVSAQNCKLLFQEIICSGGTDPNVDEQTQQECFTVMERLSIIQKLNKRLQSIPDIYNSQDYWAIIKIGVAHIDQGPRKIALTILKENLNAAGQHHELAEVEEFETLWTTFFDIMDTLESFGSHLLKAIWHRASLFYDYIQKHEEVYSQQRAINPLEDFRYWLLVIYDRINSHQNMKVRGHVIKETLKREFMTRNMTSFIFGPYISMLNLGLLFKDVTFYSVFSKHADSVCQFYCRFFQNESRDVGNDLAQLLNGLASNATHGQVYLVLLKVLQTNFKAGSDVKFYDNARLKQMLDGVANGPIMDHYFSAKYLCHKYITRSVAHYIIPQQAMRQAGQEFDWSTLFALVGELPVEFFTTRTVFTDVEGVQATSDLVESLGRQDLQSAIQDYLQSLFTTNAMPSQIAKFGQQTDRIVNGICRLILILTMKYEDPLVIWLQQFMEPILDSFRQGLSSSYLQHRLVEAKVHCFASLVQKLYDYGSDKLRLCVRQHIFLPQLSQLLSRFSESLIEPVSREAFVPSEEERFNAAFAYLGDYTLMLSMAIKMIHLHENRSDNALEAHIKTILQKALRIASPDENASSWLFGAYLLQYVVVDALSAVTETYAKGIEESIKRGVTFFFVPDDLFTIGGPLLSSLITLRPIRRPNGSEELTNSQSNFFELQNVTSTRINERVSLAIWRSMGHMLQVFQHDEGLKQELIAVTNKRIADKACDFLDAVTQEFNDVVFRILKLCYLPSVVMQLSQPDLDDQVKVDCIEQLQQIIRTCWTLTKQMGRDSTLEPMQEFVEFAFSPDLLSAYQLCLSDSMYDSLMNFHTNLFKEIVDFSDKYWLLLRTTFNHLMFMFAARPHLITFFESFIVGFGTCRELRSLDAEIKLYKLQTIIPQVVPMRYEDFDLELVSYHGAYIRTMTLMILEGIIKNHILQIQQGQTGPQIDATTNSLEQILRDLIKLPVDASNFKKCAHPWADSHRLGIRIFQMMLVMLQLLDAAVYTPAFREERVRKTGKEDIIVEILQALWEIIRHDFVPSIRQYIEIFTIKFILRFPDVALEDPKFSKTLLDPKAHKAQVSASLLIIAGYALCSPLATPNAINFKRKIYDQMIGFTTSNSAHSRCVAHYFILRLQSDSQFGEAFMPSGVQPIIDYLKVGGGIQRMFKKYAKDFDGFERLCLHKDGVDIVLSTKISKEGEYVGVPLVETLRKITTEVMCEYRKSDYIPIDRKDWWKEELERRKKEGEVQLVMNEGATQNFQKKILPWEELEVDHDKAKKAFLQRARHEIIMCASLIDKIPNIAGLSRTAEIFNASGLIINNSHYLDTDEFKSIAVTSEKWIPIYQVMEKDLLKYLHYQKSNGYKILGLEQTANSQMLHEFKFPSKCILLLGKEKEGIPQEYYGILDSCIEIPQFGIIRSLNVHVSGALCLWEYTKQQMAKQVAAAKAAALE